MRVLIIFAHAEPTSFNGSMLRAGIAALTAAGHEVEVSDLYAMGFDPVSDRRNFVTIANPDELRQQAEEALASANDGFVPDLQVEMDKLAWCDVLVFQFPIWWLGLPAILKGWVDRVFAVGRAYGGGRWFEGGFFAGKRAMCAVSVGGLENVYSADGVYAPIEDVLYSVHRGIFAFTGFSVIEPFVVYGPGRINAVERAVYLEDYVERLLTLDTAPILERSDTPAR
ncbi:MULTISPECIES: NAD(P)H-dependent oxidoreductase [unclassified Sphingomonas]|jgi:NAD(P)H dehydrogenase (quinone)|uniref:NAD(P)H-dependent oxidoreductase n=1 Tax=unclassified Sphingomonas TaxID=196159 RepID=UPI00082BD0B3|nr:MULTISPECIES: NAD(P)H-dependent oxidoreductase [unclassified Sphingomonas]